MSPSRQVFTALAVCLGACQMRPQTAAAAEKPVAPVTSVKSDAWLAPRPTGGEHFGLYLMGKKVGYIFTDLAPVPNSPDRIRSKNQFYFKANVGSKTSERHAEDLLVERLDFRCRLTRARLGDPANRCRTGQLSLGEGQLSVLDFPQEGTPSAKCMR